MIEVLIVLVVVMMAASMVTPRLFQTYETISAQAEVKMLREILEDTGLSAFATQTPQVVKLTGKGLTILPAGRAMVFKWLDFPVAREIRFNRQGFSDQQEIEVKAGGRVYAITFSFLETAGSR